MKMDVLAYFALMERIYCGIPSILIPEEWIPFPHEKIGKVSHQCHICKTAFMTNDFQQSVECPWCHKVN